MFKKEHIGMTVYDSIQFGKGKISQFYEYDEFPVVVTFPEGYRETYTIDGKRRKTDSIPTLSFTPYTLQGYTIVPPRELPEVGEMILVKINEWDWVVREYIKVKKNDDVIVKSPCVGGLGIPYSEWKRFIELDDNF
jgi:hypothetical protein